MAARTKEKTGYELLNPLEQLELRTWIKAGSGYHDDVIETTFFEIRLESGRVVEGSIRYEDLRKPTSWKIEIH